MSSTEVYQKRRGQYVPTAEVDGYVTLCYVPKTRQEIKDSYEADTTTASTTYLNND